VTRSGGNVFYLGKGSFHLGIVFENSGGEKIIFLKKYIYSKNSNLRFFQQGESCDSLASLDLKSLLGMSMLRMKNYQGRPDSL
jgi:hypothetical protein